MRHFFSIFIFVITGSVHGQDPDSLKRFLYKATDIARIDLLNEISLEYMFKDNYDSADHYQFLACIESERLGYIHGLAEAYAVRAQLEKYVFDDFPAAEAYAKVAESLYDKTSDKRKIVNVYEVLWQSLAAQSEFTEAEEYVYKEMEWCRQHNNKKCISNMHLVLASFQIEMGQFDEAFDYVNKAFTNASEFESRWLQEEQAYPGKIYMALGDYEQALEYYRISTNQLKNWESERDMVNYDIWIITEFAENYALLGKFDSAFLYYNKIDTNKNGWKDLRVYLVSMGEVFLLQQEYEKALTNFHRALPHNERMNDRSQVIRTQLDISKGYLGLKDYRNALLYVEKAMKNAKETLAKKSLMEAYELFYKCYDALQKPELANKYFRQYEQMKDSVAIDRLKGQLAASNYEKQLALLQQNKIIAEQGHQIQQQKFERANIVTKFLIAGIVLILILAGVLIRNFLLRRSRLQKDLEIQTLESKKIAVEMREKTSELKTAALRAQMNPHFIFNCLNAINHFILNNDPDLASDYLTKFSRLIRLVLNSSSSKFVPLNDELTALRIYSELEQLRFRKHFDFVLNVDPNIEPERIIIPPMLLQPFVENAIWHGLMHADNNGLLKVEITRQGNALRCVIEDNGIGRARSKEIKSRSASYKKSMGMDITKNRMKLLYDNNNQQPFMEIIDLYDEQGKGCGTRVQLDIPLKFEDDLVDSENSVV